MKETNAKNTERRDPFGVLTRFVTARSDQHTKMASEKEFFYPFNYRDGDGFLSVVDLRPDF